MGTAAETRSYERQDSLVFCKTTEVFGGLSNMAPGFPLRVNGIDILTSEALYQACRFPHLPDVQGLIIAQKSPMTAKMKSKPYRSRSREDWNVIRVRIMRWSLRVKLALNWTKFRDLLLATSDRPIVEESRKDDFWGAKVRSDGVLVGANVLGRLLMELREDLRGASCEALRRVQPPTVRDFLLHGEPIRMVEAAHADASAEDTFTTMAANRSEVHAGDRAGTASPFEPTIGSSGIATGARADSDAADGTSAKAYPRRIIEVDLPIKEISAHARREKSIRHGHISTLHIWWARRPLAACRAVLLRGALARSGRSDLPGALPQGGSRGDAGLARPARREKRATGRSPGTYARRYSRSSRSSRTGTTQPTRVSSRPRGVSPRRRMSHSAECRGRGRSSWTHSPAAGRSRSRRCASGPTSSPRISTPSRCCSTRSYSSTSQSTARGWLRSCGAGARG